MRTYDIAYVKQGTVVGYPPKPIDDLTLSEIKKKYLNMCAKSNGNVSVCKTCLTPCEYGKRAIELSTTDVPLYNGMTLIERAKLDNLTRRQEKEKKEEMTQKKSKDNRVFIKDWYEQATATDDPIGWVMNAYGIDRQKAMGKLCQWRIRHKEKTQETDVVAVKPTVTGFDAVETKIDSLMKLQDKYKQEMLKYKELYDETKRKIDVLCSAMDIVNE